MKSVMDQVAFSGGTMSPKLDARVDNPKYKHALRQCENMVPLKQGPLTRRPGTQFVASAHIQDFAGHRFAVRPMKFIFSPTTTFMLELGNHYIRFYSNGLPVQVNSAPLWVMGTNYVAGNFVTSTVNALIYYCITDDPASPTDPSANPNDWRQQTVYEIPSPYSGDVIAPNDIWSADVWTVVPCQINDVVYLSHPSYPPYSLTRFGDTDWVIKEVNYISPALLDQNTTDTTITPSATTGNGITLTASAPAWITAKYYSLGNSVLQAGSIYNCVTEHVSGTFATDLAAGDWVLSTIFVSGHVGSTWQLNNLRPAAYVEYDGVAATGFAAGSSGPIACIGTWEVHTYGVWSADIAIRRSFDGGQTWDTVRTFSGRSDRNVDLTGSAVKLALYQIVVDNVAVPVNPGATNPRVVFECVDGFLHGLVKITAVANAYSATANVITQLYSATAAPVWISGNAYYLNDLVEDPGDSNNIYICLAPVTSATQPHSDPANWVKSSIPPTPYWAEGAWSDYRGYPQSICSFQQRVIYGATAYEPQRIWGTVTNDIENFALGDQTLATDSFAFDINAPGAGPIVWLMGQTNLFLGFSGAEWVANSGAAGVGSQSAGAAITPTNISATQMSAWGSAYGVQPYVVGDAVMFCRRQATSIRQMLFSIYTNKYMSQDVTSMADNLFPAGIVQLDYQPKFRGQGLMWCVTKQGTLCSLTYELDEGVFGWAYHTTGYNQTDPDGTALLNDGGFEGVAVIDGSGQTDDEVWVVVNRKLTTTLGAVVTHRYIERINPNNWESTFTAAPLPPIANFSDAFYVDAGITVLTPGRPTITGLDHLENRWVTGLADGLAFAPQLVVGGSITIPNMDPAGPAKVQVGLPVRYTCQPMRIDSDARMGSTQGQLKQISDTFIRVMNSLGGYISNGATGANAPLPVPIPYPNPANPLAGPLPVTSPTDIRIQPQLGAVPSTDPIVIVTANDALPLTVLAIIDKYDQTSVP